MPIDAPSCCEGQVGTIVIKRGDFAINSALWQIPNKKEEKQQTVKVNAFWSHHRPLASQWANEDGWRPVQKKHNWKESPKKGWRGAVAEGTHWWQHKPKWQVIWVIIKAVMCSQRKWITEKRPLATCYWRPLESHLPNGTWAISQRRKREKNCREPRKSTKRATSQDKWTSLTRFRGTNPIGLSQGRRRARRPCKVNRFAQLPILAMRCPAHCRLLIPACWHSDTLTD